MTVMEVSLDLPVVAAEVRVRSRGRMERVRLADLEPNPIRDFDVDPVDRDAVERLKTSIREDGFWGGVVGRRRKDGETEIVAGTHRVTAAIEEGIEEAEIFVIDEEDMDELSILWVYARENATQRGVEESTARAGSVASAIEVAAHDIWTWNLERNGAHQNEDDEVSPHGDTSYRQWPFAHLTTKKRQEWRDSLNSNEGLGGRILQAYLPPDVVSQRTITQDLAALKQAPNYAKIIGRVRDRIAAEEEQVRQAAEAARVAAEAARERAEQARQAAEAAEEKERAAAKEQQRCEEAAAREAEAAAEEQEKAAEKLAPVKTQATKVAGTAKEKKAIFDFEGVAQHLKVAEHLKVFRELVTRPTIQTHVAFDQQAELAALLVEAAQADQVQHPHHQGLTAGFIRENLHAHIGQLRRARKRSQKEDEKLEEESWEIQFKHAEERFEHYLRSAVGPAKKLKLLAEKAPEGVVVRCPVRTQKQVREIRSILDWLASLDQETEAIEGEIAVARPALGTGGENKEIE